MESAETTSPPIRRHSSTAHAVLPDAVGPAMTPNPALFYPTLAPKKSANQTPRELRVMLLRGLREDEAFTDLRDTQAYREAAARLEESLQKEN